jgi:hypothetical protein
MGGSLGLAILATIAVDRTRSARHGGASLDHALTAGYSRAFYVATAISVAALLGSWIVPAIRRRNGEEARHESAAEETEESLVDGNGGALPTLDPA